MLVPGALMDRGFSCSQHHSALFGAYSILGNENGSGDRHASPPFLQSLLCVKHIVHNLLQTWGPFCLPWKSAARLCCDRMLQAVLVDH